MNLVQINFAAWSRWWTLSSVWVPYESLMMLGVESCLQVTWNFKISQKILNWQYKEEEAQENWKFWTLGLKMTRDSVYTVLGKVARMLLKNYPHLTVLSTAYTKNHCMNIKGGLHERLVNWHLSTTCL